MLQLGSTHDQEKQTITIEYALDSKPRYSIEKPHPKLYDIINKRRNVYRNTLLRFNDHVEKMANIPMTNPENVYTPFWYKNTWLPPLDAIALYCFVADHQPRQYLEIGSGMSTKFAKRSIVDHELDTRLISIDPHPRNEIDNICDEVIRHGLEDTDLKIFETLEADDILFYDGSHQCFMNSDVTVFFLEVLPRLKPGVIVQVHDIFLPYDYSKEWVNRYYSEHYLLACYLLAKTSLFSVKLPNKFISAHQDMVKLLDPVLTRPELKGIWGGGGSFWMEML